MNLIFNITLEDILAFNKEYHMHSKAIRRMRRIMQFTTPLILMLLFVFTSFRDQEFSFSVLIIYIVISVLWIIFQPKRFDANLLKSAKKCYKDENAEKIFEKYQITLSDDGLFCEEPNSKVTYNWKAIDRVVLNKDYLHVFIGAMKGYPIKVSEIGQEAAQSAKDFIEEKIS